MPATKTENLTYRISPDVKAKLREDAAREHRSLATMSEVMIRGYRPAAVPGVADVAETARIVPPGSR
ncbi:MAG: hypothetical protein N838_07525 [Thiohalocapsa sp. PB-PSB1]|jgi:hypothetical protein|nr:MAG: hypothetical protein N838_20200 [Thiohalocapsa sp. PB-PSB1]QQO53237.1 MAG: hypothetical protein N838_07525 [Thiohalocapsa sp. PB-PSB1]